MIIMDTCAIIWDALDNKKLSPKAKQAIRRADSNRELIICDISFWEISMLIQRKRLEITETARSFQVQGLTPEIAELSVNFDQEINNDPADRLIAATSITHDAPIVTSDQNLRNSGILETIW